MLLTKFRGILCLLVLLVFAAHANAQSSKATAAVGNVGILDSYSRGWSTIMASSLKTANAKDLFINVALECGLYTKTQVKGKKGSRDSSSAESKVTVRVLIDGQVAKPGEVIFCQRSQELSAVLGGVLESCSDTDLDGVILSDECNFTEEEISLVLSTMTANSFNFILDDLNSGFHEIKVQAKIKTGADYSSGQAEARATIGHGSVVVEEVRMIKDNHIDF